MLSKLHQNSVLTGCIDSFCLVCEAHLWREGDADTHIIKPVHLKNLNSAPFFTKFPDDHIRKVKKGYFCEFCNILLPTSAKVGLHVTEQTHNDNKGLQMISRAGKNVIISDKTLITEQAWNGIIMDTCAVCNVEFHNLKLHIADQKHVLNLIQKKVEFDGNTVYRKIDDTSFHCLICNAIFALNTVTTHSKDDVHETNVKKCRKFYQSNFENKSSCVGNGQDDSQQPKTIYNIDNKGKQASVIAQTPKIEETKTKIKPKPSFTNGICDLCTSCNQKNDPIVDKPKSEKTENTHSESLKQNAKGIKQNAKDPNQTKNNSSDRKNTVTVDKDKLFEHVPEFQKNGVNINFETETAFCKKCFREVDLDIDIIKEHIEGHKSNPKKGATVNNVHTINQNHSRTVLNGRDKDDSAANSKLNFDLNHNLTNSKIEREPMKEKQEELIKIDLTKKSDEDFTETENNNAVATYIPGASQAELPKQKDTTQQPPKPTDPNDPAAFAKQNSMTYNEGNGNAYCRICSTRVPATIRNMKEHVAGMPHKTKLARKIQAEKPAKVPSRPMSKFIEQSSTVMTVFGVDDVILNDKHCLTRMSFNMITTQNRLRCQACEANLRDDDDVIRHVDGIFHERAMERTPVVTSFSAEFIREVRPGVFHCGFCNQVVGSWEVVSIHLQCTEHVASKRAASDRLKEHLPGILAHRAAREEVFVRHFLMNRMGIFPF